MVLASKPEPTRLEVELGTLKKHVKTMKKTIDAIKKTYKTIKSYGGYFGPCPGARAHIGAQPSQPNMCFVLQFCKQLGNRLVVT